MEGSGPLFSALIQGHQEVNQIDSFRIASLQETVKVGQDRWPCALLPFSGTCLREFEILFLASQ